MVGEHRIVERPAIPASPAESALAAPCPGQRRRGDGTGLRPWLAGAALLLAALGSGRPAAAQSPADTVELARAVAVVIGDSLLPHLRGAAPTLLGEPATPFDWRVTQELRDAHRLPLMPAEAEQFQWVVTRGLALRGDTAAVLVELGTTRRPGRQAIDTYIETYRYLFLRTPRGWQLVRREFVSGADIGRVRG